MRKFDTAVIDVAFVIKFERGTEPPEPDDFAAMIGDMLDSDAWTNALNMWLLPMSDWYGDDTDKDRGLAGISNIQAVGYRPY